MPDDRFLLKTQESWLGRWLSLQSICCEAQGPEFNLQNPHPLKQTNKQNHCSGKILQYYILVSAEQVETIGSQPNLA